MNSSNILIQLCKCVNCCFLRFLNGSAGILQEFRHISRILYFQVQCTSTLFLRFCSALSNFICAFEKRSYTLIHAPIQLYFARSKIKEKQKFTFSIKRNLFFITLFCVCFFFFHLTSQTHLNRNEISRGAFTIFNHLKIPNCTTKKIEQVKSRSYKNGISIWK